MAQHIPTQADLSAETRAFYSEALRLLNQSGIPYLVGGTYAFERYTGIVRHTKDLDIFVRRHHRDGVLELFAAQGYAIEVYSSYWLAKVYCQQGSFIDIILNSASGNDHVNDHWFERAVPETVFDQPVLICSVEEMVRSKAFVMTRERYDGADVAHLIHACAEKMDWQHLVRRFGEYWRVLLSHLVLFGFVYPGEQGRIPDWVMRELLARIEGERESPSALPVCQGTFFSATDYLVDVERWGYVDARVQPFGSLSTEEVNQFLEALTQQKSV